MSRIEELLEEVVVTNNRIADRLDELVFAVDRVRSELDWVEQNSMAKQLLDAIQSIQDGVSDANTTLSNIDQNTTQ